MPAERIRGVKILYSLLKWPKSHKYYRETPTRSASAITPTRWDKYSDHRLSQRACPILSRSAYQRGQIRLSRRYHAVN